MHTYSSETLIAGVTWELGYCACLIVVNQNSCIFLRWNQVPFSFSYHRLAYAAEYEKVAVKFIVGTNLSNETIKVKRFIFMNLMNLLAKTVKSSLNRTFPGF